VVVIITSVVNEACLFVIVGGIVDVTERIFIVVVLIVIINTKVLLLINGEIRLVYKLTRRRIAVKTLLSPIVIFNSANVNKIICLR